MRSIEGVSRICVVSFSVAKREMEEADARREARRLRHCYETPRSVGGATSYSAVMQEKQKAATSAATGLQIQVMDIPIINSVLATEWLGWAGAGGRVSFFSYACQVYVHNRIFGLSSLVLCCAPRDFSLHTAFTIKKGYF